MTVQFTEEYLGELLLNKLKESENYEKAISLVKDNSKGNIYLVGGTVSRTLASAIYGGTMAKQDFDFVVDILNKEFAAPPGWTVSTHKFGNPTFKNGEIDVDIFPLSDHPHIKQNNLEPTINNFLEGTPFTIQSLAFDVRNHKLIGKIGIKALKEKKFGVNNARQAKEVAERKGIPVNERIRQKAGTMNFDIEPFD